MQIAPQTATEGSVVGVRQRVGGPQPNLVGALLVVQGLGQAAFEHVVYDPESGQLLSGSFLDYCVPRAGQVPMIDFVSLETPAPSNPAGFKGCGEAGAAGAPPAFANAVVDALKPLGVRHIDMPLTPERVWRAIRAASHDR